MGREKMRDVFFDTKEDLSKSSFRKEVGDKLKVERKEINPDTGKEEVVKERIEAHKVQEYFKDKVVESGDSPEKIDKKLKEEHSLKNGLMFLRKHIVGIFKKIFKKKKTKDYKQIKDDAIKRNLHNLGD